MELHQLDVFLAVARERSFSKAATKLFRTQPAVSQAIRNLELEIGAPLFERSTRTVRLTDSGATLVDYAQRIVNLRDELPAAIRELRDLHRGKIVLAANEFTVNYLLPLLQSFHDRCPEISVEVRRALAREIPRQVLQHAVDLGITSFDPQDKDLQCFTIATDPLVLVLPCAHRLAGATEVSVKQLGGEIFIAHNVASPHRQKVIETFAQHRTDLWRKFELPTIEAIKRGVQMGMGVALLPRVTVELEVRSNTLCAVSVRELKLERTLRLVCRKNARLTYAAQAFLDNVQNITRKSEAASSGL